MWGNGAALTGLNATNVASGTLATARGGTGLGGPTAAGQFLRSTGSGTWALGTIQSSDLPAPGSGYVQNQSTSTQTASFKISGNGTVSSLNWSSGASLANDQGGSIELGNGSGTPFIDFHGATTGQDFNVRLINSAANVLTIATNAGSDVIRVGIDR